MKYIKRFNESVKHSDIINLLNVIEPYLNKTLDVELKDNVLYVDVDIPSKFEGGKNEMISLQRYLQKYGMEKDSIASFYLKIEDNKDDKEIFIKDLEDTIGYLQRKMKREISDLSSAIQWKEEDIENLEYLKKNPEDDHLFTKHFTTFSGKYKKPSIRTLKKEINSLKKEINEIKKEYESYIEEAKLEIEKVKSQSISNIEYVKKFLNENS
jgi:hypothetical protein